MVAELPHDSGSAAEIVIVTYNNTDGGSESGYGSNSNYYGVIRVLNGQTCEQLETIDDSQNRIVGASPPAIADLNGDGIPEIVTQRAITGLVAFQWNATSNKYERYWVATNSDISSHNRWDGPAVHDLDDDTFPEVISGGEVYDGRTGTRLNDGQVIGGQGRISVVGDVDGDKTPELIYQDIYSWNKTTDQWDFHYPGPPDSGKQHAFADFGTPGETAADFDPTTLDGIAEIVVTGNDVAYLTTLDGQVLLSVTNITGGGAPTIGDFDNDGFPEFASAGGNFYRVFDLECKTGTEPGCAAKYIRWQQPSQDLSSKQTGSAIFDFEGDGKAEAVYADECFTRIYEGKTGEVLYSAFRTSCTWYENPVIADPDKDSNTEILIGSNANCGIGCPAIDPIHRGVSCETNLDCISGVCDEGYCRCTGDGECADGYRCEAELSGTPGTGKTCRAYHPPGTGLTGLRVLRDRLDRWASSRPLWNQHAYSITNINDNMSVPRTSEWLPNYRQSAFNNYRQNKQGETSATDFPDITGRFDRDTVCAPQSGGSKKLLATVCNRGTRPVGAALPATFYAGEVAEENVVCVSYTDGPVPVGGCLDVSCSISSTVEGTLTLVVNDDGEGGRITVECEDENNEHTSTVNTCAVVE